MIPPCLTHSYIRYVSRVKRSNPGKGVVPSPTSRCSSDWKGSLLVALDYGCQLYFVAPLHILLYCNVRSCAVVLYKCISQCVSTWNGSITSTKKMKSQFKIWKLDFLTEEVGVTRWNLTLTFRSLPHTPFSMWCKF